MAPKYANSTDPLFKRGSFESRIDMYYGGMKSADCGTAENSSSNNERFDDGAAVTNDENDPRRRAHEKREVDAVGAAFDWAVGDLVVFRTDGDDGGGAGGASSSTRRPPPPRPPSQQVFRPDEMVGQVLAFVVSQGATDPEPSYGAVVRHLLPWEEACKVLQPGEQKTAKSHCKGKFRYGLLETRATSVVELQRIDASCSVVFKDQTALSLGPHHQKRTPSSSESSEILVVDQVYGSFDGKGLVLYSPQHNDWNNDGYRIKYSNFVPLPLQRGWKCLRDKELREALRSKLLPALQEDRNLVPCPEDLLLGAELDDDDDSSDDEPTPPESLPASVTGDESDAGPSSPRPPKQPIPRKGAKRRPPGAASQTQIAARKRTSSNPPKRRRAADPEEGPRLIEVKPPSPPVFTLRPSKAVSIPHPLSFYTHVQVTANVRAWSHPPPGGAAPPPPKHWTVNVGDVVMVAADPVREDGAAGSAAGRQSPKKSAETWHPFTVPWHVAQVLSIYQRKDGVATSHQGSAGDPPEAGPADGWRMEVRWFLRPGEMMTSFGVEPPKVSDSDNSIVEIDEYVESVPVQIALGRARLASSSPAGELGDSIDDDGVPTRTFLCQHMYVMQFDERRVRSIEDWVPGFGSSLAGPLSRALLCEKAWPGKRGASRLQKAYSKFLTQRFQVTKRTFDSGIDVESIGDDEDSLASFVDRGRASWPTSIDSPNQHILCSSILRHSIGRDYLSSINLSTCLKRFDARATAKKIEALPPWKLSVGDCVCLASAHADHVPPPSSLSKNPWYPFQGPWNVAQVLSIYCATEGESAGRTQLEVRLFRRPGEVPAGTRVSLPPPLDDEVFESDIVEQDVSVSRVLSRCVVQRVQPLDANCSQFGKEVVRRSRYILLSDSKQFLPVFSMNSFDWITGLLQRGIRFSKLIHGDPALSEWMSDLVCGKLMEAPSSMLPPECAVPMRLCGNLYMSVPVAPQWDAFEHFDLMCPPEVRSSVLWEVKVGDLVASRAEVLQGCSGFPLLVHWKPCQVLSIWSEPHSEGPSKATVHWLPCDRSPLATNFIGVDTYLSGSDSPFGTVELTSFLCPLTVVVNKSTRVTPTTGPAFLPSAVMEYTSSFAGDAHGIFKELLVKGISDCSCYDATARAKVFRVLGVNDAAVFDAESSNIHNASASSTAQTLGPPIYIAESAKLNFHAAVNVSTRESVLEKSQRNDSLPGKPRRWEVRLGDIVAVQGSGRWRRSETLPFTVPWSVAEVVTIYEQIPSNDREVQDSAFGGIQVEVRWFYQPSEVSKFTRSSGNAASRTATSTSPELFESDHYEIIPASRLLAPVVLKARSELTERGDDNARRTTNALEFTCCQFWSHHRKSLVPIGNLEGRISRGRAQSSFFGKYDALQVACARVAPQNASAFKAAKVTLSPEVAFQRVIDKLSLTDASKEALHDSSGIVGREQERKIISSFLHDAVFGPDGDDKAFSLFLAGPPGVGKTACVRACVNGVKQLETENARFDFFIVNGMELRNPDDAYTVMWEEISPDRERCTSAWAKEELETYFTCPPSDGRHCRGKRGELERVVVVLVDEVDYLVTKKQSLLYDIFDWPTRAIHGRRLVVIAVSNTVNLPEQLHPRVQSRMTKRCFFKAYAEKEISDIVRAKVAQASPTYTVFSGDAINFVSKKTATSSGDIRKAFFLLRVAAEMILTESETSDPQDEQCALQVGIKDVVQVSRDAFNSAQCKGVALLAPYEALFLVALACLCRWTGREQGGFDLDDILTKMKALANALGDERYLPPPTLGEALAIATRLGEARVIGLSTSTTSSTSHRPGVSGGGGPWPLVSMAMDDAAVFEALKKTENRELALKLMQVGGGEST